MINKCILHRRHVFSLLPSVVLFLLRSTRKTLGKPACWHGYTYASYVYWEPPPPPRLEWRQCQTEDGNGVRHVDNSVQRYFGTVENPVVPRQVNQ